VTKPQGDFFLDSHCTCIHTYCQFRSLNKSLHTKCGNILNVLTLACIGSSVHEQYGTNFSFTFINVISI